MNRPEDKIEEESAAPPDKTRWARVYSYIFIWLAVMSLLMYLFSRWTQ